VRKFRTLLVLITFTITGTGCSSNGKDDMSLVEYSECLQRVMDEAAKSGTDKFDMSVCDVD
jgi:hypothetical protein